MPEQDGPEHHGWIEDAVIPLAVGGVAQVVHDGGDDQNDDQQHHPAHNGGSTAGLGTRRGSGTVAVVVQVVLVQGGEQVQHPFAVRSGRHAVIEVLAEVDPDLAVRQGVIHAHGEIGVPVLRVDGQIAVVGPQFKFLCPVIGVLLQAGVGSGGQGLHHDDAAVSLIPVGVVQANLLLLLVGEHPGKVSDPLLIGPGGQ